MTPFNSPSLNRMVRAGYTPRQAWNARRAALRFYRSFGPDAVHVTNVRISTGPYVNCTIITKDGAATDYCVGNLRR